MATGTDFGDLLTAAIHGGYLAHLTGPSYTVTSSIVINVTSTIQGPMGIDLGGARIVSQITDGSPVIQINVGPGVDLRYVTLSNFTIEGNGLEGDGIRIVADGNDRWMYCWTLENVTVQHVGGFGLDVQGSVFEGIVSNSWMIGNAQGGASFAHSDGGGQVSALRWFGGGFEDNGGAGLMLDNGARDISVDGRLLREQCRSGHQRRVGHHLGERQRLRGQSRRRRLVSELRQLQRQHLLELRRSGGRNQRLSGRRRHPGRQQQHLHRHRRRPTTLAEPARQWHGVPGGQQRQGRDRAATRALSGRAATSPMSPRHGRRGLPNAGAITAGTTAAVAAATERAPWRPRSRAAIARRHRRPSDGHHLHRRHADRHQHHRLDPGPLGIDLGGAKIISQIADGGPVIEIIIGRRVDIGTLTLSNFSIQGNGQEGDGIKIVADGTDRWIRDLDISNVNVEHVGGIGLDVLGNVRRAPCSTPGCTATARAARASPTAPAAGWPSMLEWVGGGFRKNGVAGLILDNGAHDLSIQGAYFVDNDGPGIQATAGITPGPPERLREQPRHRRHRLGLRRASLTTASRPGAARRSAIGGYLTADQVSLLGVGNEYYGAGDDPTVLANLQGQGTLAIAGGGNVVAGPNVAVTGALTAEIEALGSTALIEVTGSYFLYPVGGSSGPQLSYSGAPVGVGQLGAWAPIGVEQTASGYQVVWQLGDADQYTVWTTDSSGNWLSQGATLSGASPALQSLEPGFQQDLNGDGSIPLPTVINSSGMTALARTADVYLLYPVGGSLGPHLTYGGAPVTAGQFGAWAPIGVERAASGYQVAFQLGSTDLYTVWTTDGSGNWLSQSPGVSGSDRLVCRARAELRPGPQRQWSDHADDGGRSGRRDHLVQIADTYFLYPDGGSSGPQLRYGGAR